MAAKIDYPQAPGIYPQKGPAKGIKISTPTVLQGLAFSRREKVARSDG